MPSTAEPLLAAPLPDPPGSPEVPAGPVDVELMATLSTRMHCRTPMQRVDPDSSPIRETVHVDIAAPMQVGDGPAQRGMPADRLALQEQGGPADSAAMAERAVTYRCACGFTIDGPADELP